MGAPSALPNLRPTTDPAVSVVVPAYQAEGTIGRTLAGLLDQRLDLPYEVIVVDNRSTDRTAEIVAAAGSAVRLVEGPGLGPGAARNMGAQRARAPALAFIDADCFPAPGWLAAGLDALSSLDVAQGLVRADRSATLGPWDRTLWVLADQGLYQTANLFMRRSWFEAVGGFDDWTPPTTDRLRPFGEDVDLVWRARRAGARAGFAPDAPVEHAVFPRPASAYIAERRRLRHFPALARRVPELRAETFFARLFLTRRSAAFCLALGGLASGLLLRRPAGLVACLPYAASVAGSWRNRGLRGALIELAADAVGSASLAEGSIKARSPLL